MQEEGRLHLGLHVRRSTHTWLSRRLFRGWTRTPGSLRVLRRTPYDPSLFFYSVSVSHVALTPADEDGPCCSCCMVGCVGDMRKARHAAHILLSAVPSSSVESMWGHEQLTIVHRMLRVGDTPCMLCAAGSLLSQSACVRTPLCFRTKCVCAP